MPLKEASNGFQKMAVIRKRKQGRLKNVLHIDPMKLYIGSSYIELPLTNLEI